MKVSEIIEELEKAKEKFGDMEVVVMVDSGEDTLYPIEFPRLDIFKYKDSHLFEEGQFKSKYDDCLLTEAFAELDEDESSLYDD